MPCPRFMVVWVLLLVCTTLSSGHGAELGRDEDTTGPPSVSLEEYRVYEHVIRTKYLTSHTRLVVIQQETTNRLEPAGPPVRRADLEQDRFFGGRLSTDLVIDFVLKNTRPARLDARFDLGVRYRLVMPGAEHEEVSGARPVQHRLRDEPPATVGRLLFSRVGFSPRRDEALVYAAEERPDGTGGGLLVWLTADGEGWRVSETEVVWVARGADE